MDAPHNGQPVWKVAIGQQIGPYVILDRLGQGGMGQVFLATDPRLRRKVALKYLYAALKPEDTLRTSVLREAEAVARIMHPNVAIVYDVVEHDERTFIVMEYVEGETLTSRLARERLPEATVIRFGRQLSSALAVAHAKGIVHRDLKPSNIQVTPDNTVKILDFGVAQVCELLSTVVATATASVGCDVSRTTPIGTLGYMSPEQMRGQHVDTLSDLFSLGAVLFEMATGRRLFVGNGATEIAAVMSKPLPRADEIDVSVSRKLSDVIAELIQLDPRRRVQSAIGVESRLAALEPTVRDSATSVERIQAAESLIQEMRQRLILAQAPPEVVRVKYEVERFLADRPNDVDGRLLKDDVDRALSMRFVPAVVPARMTPPKASRSRLAWYTVSVVIAIAFAGSLLVFRDRANVPRVADGSLPSSSMVHEPATLPTPAVPVTPAPEDRFRQHLERAETLIAEGNTIAARSANANALAVLPGDSRALAQLNRIIAMPQAEQGGTRATRPSHSVQGSGVAGAPGAVTGNPPSTVTVPAPPATTDEQVAAARAGPTSAPRVSDAEAIRETLRAYAAAMERLSSEAVQRVYPGVDATALERSFRLTHSMQVEIFVLEVTVDSAGASAVAQCRVRQAFTPWAGRAQQVVVPAVFLLQKTGGRWVITERR